MCLQESHTSFIGSLLMCATSHKQRKETRSFTSSYLFLYFVMILDNGFSWDIMMCCFHEVSESLYMHL